MELANCIILARRDERRGPSPEKLDLWLDCYTPGGKKVRFWGSVDRGTRNIDSILVQRFPVMVELDPRETKPSPWVAKEYGAWRSVDAETSIAIVPNFGYTLNIPAGMFAEMENSP